jgi:dihydrofolate synthase / folylpolyglutamate synthase
MSNFNKVKNELVKYIYRRGINYSLDNFHEFLQSIGNPHLKLKNVIHIAGTNGKGSTLTFIAQALISAGYKVGSYTSPHLFEYTERICLNLKPITKKDFVRLFDKCFEDKLLLKKYSPTEFEILTAMSFLYFAESKPDYIIYETGLGGRLDATNVVSPIISLITKIDLDHQAILGNKIEDIAQEKAGIIKQKIPVVTIKQRKAVIDILKKKALDNKAPIHIAWPIKKIPSNYIMKASFQRQNLAIAKKCLQLLGLPKQKSKKALNGLAKANILGRYQKIIKDKKTIIMDSAHNPSAIKALLKSLKDEKQPIVFILGILKRKNASKMIENIVKVKNTQTHSPLILYCDFLPGESYSYDEIEKVFLKIGHKNYREFDLTTDLLPDVATIVITGSIYLLGLFSNFK